MIQKRGYNGYPGFARGREKLVELRVQNLPVSICQHLSAFVSIFQHLSVFVSIFQYSSAFVSIHLR